MQGALGISEAEDALTSSDEWLLMAPKGGGGIGFAAQRRLPARSRFGSVSAGAPYVAAFLAEALHGIA